MQAFDLAQHGGGGFKGGFRAPNRATTFGMILFLAALGMLFAASMLGYVVIRVWGSGRSVGIELPRGLWISTVLMVASSVSFHRALRAIRLERQEAFRRWLAATIALAAGFLLVQIPSMSALLLDHADARGRGFHLYGLLFFLVLLHALHVVGGMVALGRIGYVGFKGRYDHEHHAPVRHAAMYWHFLDGVWIVMFAVLQFSA